MTVSIVPSSPQAIELAKNPPQSNGRGRKSYPFDELAIGQSFTIPIAEANMRSLKVIVSRKSKDGKTFVVIPHAALVEVARIA